MRRRGSACAARAKARWSRSSEGIRRTWPMAYVDVLVDATSAPCAACTPSTAQSTQAVPSATTPRSVPCRCRVATRASRSSASGITTSSASTASAARTTAATAAGRPTESSTSPTAEPR
ncbi:hypothetical protein KRR39_23835 [Nocardioides panacis]|uniref:Uncharacterized protein n=1 Tax=Nocardioides panacis TaxID=2849501 RepID=A0A975Y0C6_9ACTN|nr:hypothetical protein [Nocardioides panacis]QWZ08300.1 hypothetical protein KRR39_23835 [Nocardioides panacis]